MANRQTIGSGTAGAVSGDDYMDNVAGHLTRLFDASAFPLTSIGGTGNAVTAVLDPVLTAGLVTGMKFTLTWAAANTGAVTLAINGAAAVAVLGAGGTALTTGALQPGERAMIEFDGTALRVLTGAGSAADGAALPVYTLMTVSGTWTKPTGYPADHRVMVEVVGGGGGGDGSGGGCGGGGGGYFRRWLRMSQIPSSVTCTIGAGGAADGNGGNTSFGALAIGYGGAAGSGGAFPGGGGGGAIEAGSGVNGGFQGGGDGGATAALAGDSASTECGGGGGGGGENVGPATNGKGGRAVYGGGGGGGRSGNSGSHGAGGVSRYGGNGGSGGVAGQAPGGGGGGNAAGARGEIRIWL